MRQQDLVLKMNVYHHMSWWDRYAYHRARIMDSVYLAAAVAVIYYVAN
jgi:hypothetical protein